MTTGPSSDIRSDLQVGALRGVADDALVEAPAEPVARAQLRLGMLAPVLADDPGGTCRERPERLAPAIARAEKCTRVGLDPLHLRRRRTGQHVHARVVLEAEPDGR